MKVEVVLTEADIALEFAEAIEARDLPEFFFWFTRSAAEWAALGEHRRVVWRSMGNPKRHSASRVGVRLSGLIFDAGPANSPVLLTVGTRTRPQPGRRP